MSFPTAVGGANLAEMIGIHYFAFGLMLLDRYKVAAIEFQQNRNAANINREIFILWLQGKGQKPVTWDTFIGALKSIQLHILAKMVETNTIRKSVKGKSE